MLSMKVKIRQPAIDVHNDIYLQTIDNEKSIVVNFEALLSIDGSTTNTGVGILRKSDGALAYSCSFEREEGETPVQYKVRLKRAIDTILSKNPAINLVVYEEPFVGYATAAKNLFMLRTFVEELVVENEPKYDYLKHFEYNNLAWKKGFLAPEKVPSGTEAQKKAVRHKLETYMPYLKEVTQDEIDAISMGMVIAKVVKTDGEQALTAKKKAHPFKYNIQFLGAEDDDIVIDEVVEYFEGPKYLFENGILWTEISGTANFDKHVYNSMGEDDKVVIVKFDSNHHGDLILKHKIGNLACEYPNIYAVVWRKSRKN